MAGSSWRTTLDEALVAASFLFLWIVATALLVGAIREFDDLERSWPFAVAWLVLTSLIALRWLRPSRLRPARRPTWQPPAEIAAELARLEAAAEEEPTVEAVVAVARFRVLHGDLEGGEDRWVQAVRLEPDDPALLGEYARFLLDRREDATTAAALLARALRAAPDEPDLRACQARLHPPEEEARQLRRVLDDHPDHQASLEWLARLGFFRRQGLEETLELFERARRHTSSGLLLALYGGLVFRVLRDAERAAPLFARSLELEPRSATVLASAAWFERRRGDVDRAEQLHREALELAPTDPFVLGGLAELLLRDRDDPHGAELLHLQALTHEPGNPRTRAMVRAAWCEHLLVCGRLPEAREQASRAWEELRQDVPLVLLGLIARLEGGDDRPALARLAAWLEAGDRSVWAWDALLDALADRLSEEDLELYRAIVDVVIGRTGHEALDRFERWTAAGVVALDAPWPE